MFAGQGAQYPGMGRELYESSPAARSVFDMAERLRPGTAAQCFCGTAEELGRTLNTQPCLFAVDLACAAALAEKGVKAAACAGFSLGEAAACAFAGVLGYEDAFRLVCKRAELMDAAAGKYPGGMSAVMKLDAAAVEAIAEKYDKVFPVNYNCPGQTVVAGEKTQLAAFEAEIAANRGKAVRLKVSGGFHSPFMTEAAEELLKFMRGLTFHTPEIPVYSNAEAAPYGDAKTLLAKQIKSPVQWQKSVERMQADGFDIFIEAGPGKTLCGLMQKIGGAEIVCRAENDATLAETLLRLKEGGVC